jgi:Protein of unknown function (DUF1549)
VFVKFGQANDQLRVELMGQDSSADESRPLAERSLVQGSDELAAPLPPGRELLVMLGSVDARSDARRVAVEKDWQAAVAPVAGFRLLPNRWYGYEGVDLVVLATSEPETYEHGSGERLEALTQWVRMGGRLLLAVGRAGTEVLAADAPLSRFAPGKLSELIPLRQTGALETFAGTSERLDRAADRAPSVARSASATDSDFVRQTYLDILRQVPTGDEVDAFVADASPDKRERLIATLLSRPKLLVPKLVDVHGRIEAYEGNHPRDLPLVVRSAFGLGEVIFVGLDLDRPPFLAWRGRVSFIDRLLARPQAAEQSSDRRVLGQVTELGYTDLAGQLHLALSQFAGVQLVPFAVVAALVAVYILCIGPLDYLFLKKIVGRMELTWVTFPALVLAFSGGTYWLAHLLKGDQLRTNLVDVVDVDAESGLVRGTSWSTLFSPRIETFDLSVATRPGEVGLKGDPSVLLSWMAVPGSGLSGVGRAAGAAMFTHPYDFSPTLDAIEDLPIAMWSTRSLLARWWSEAPSPVTAQLSDRGDHMLSGTLELPADWTLVDAVLVYDRWAYPLDGRTEGRTVDVDKQLEPQTVETYFRHITVFDEKSGWAPYDRASTDLVRVVETMMFHTLTGGELYTNLTNRAQGYVDLSSQVRLGRAVLLGRTDRPASQLLRHATQGDSSGGKPLEAEGQRQTFYRFVLPVTQVGD